MNRLAKIAAAAAIVLGAGTISANAACDGDASTETVLGAGSGAMHHRALARLVFRFRAHDDLSFRIELF